MLTLINDQDIINLIYNFIFGFSDSKTNYVFTYNTEKETSFMAETLSNSNTNSNANIPNSTEKQYKNDLKNSGKKNSISYTHSRTNSINSVLSKNFNLQSDNNENMISNSNNNYGGLNTLNTFSNSSSNNNSASKNNNNSAYKNQVSSNNPDTYANNNSYNNYDSKYNQKSNPEYLSTKNSEENINQNTNTNLTSTEYEESLENNFYLNQDYNFKAHNNIRIALKIFNNMNNQEESINLVISSLFEKFFEKCPFFMFNRLLFPFAEFCLRQIDDPNKFLKVKKTIPDLDSLYNLVKLYDDAKNLNFYFDTNIKAISFNTLNHYIKNDIDFYFYYLNQRQDKENYDYYNEDEKNQNFNLDIKEANNNEENGNGFSHQTSGAASIKPRFSVRDDNKEIVAPSHFAYVNIDRESIKRVLQTPKNPREHLIYNPETPKNNENFSI